MSAFNHFKTLPALFENINNLCALLWQSKREYEQAAATLTDEALSRTILTLAQENNQYACELSAQLRILGSIVQEETVQEEKKQEPEAKVETKPVGDKSAVLGFCKRKEKKMVRAYQKLLKKSYLNKEMRNMIRYQLVGMRNASEQLQLLSSLWFN